MTKRVTERRDLVSFYKDKSGQWRWERVASNGKIVGASTEAFKKRSAAVANYQRQLTIAAIVR